jgi:hypothetical protein
MVQIMLALFVFTRLRGVLESRMKKRVTDYVLQADAGLPAGWEVRHSNSKNLPYYFNAAQQLSRWEPPPGTNTDKLKTYMATHHTAQEIKPEPSAVNGNEGKIRAAHLLIKHQDSRRPSSWREVCLNPLQNPITLLTFPWST